MSPDDMVRRSSCSQFNMFASLVAMFEDSPGHCSSRFESK